MSKLKIITQEDVRKSVIASGLHHILKNHKIAMHIEKRGQNAYLIQFHRNYTYSPEGWVSLYVHDTKLLPEIDPAKCFCTLSICSRLPGFDNYDKTAATLFEIPACDRKRVILRALTDQFKTLVDVFVGSSL